MWDYYGWHGYGMGFGMLFMAFFWILVIAGTVWIVMMLTRGAGGHMGGGGPRESSALEVLKRRYARGEIDKNEYEQKRKDLLE